MTAIAYSDHKRKVEVYLDAKGYKTELMYKGTLLDPINSEPIFSDECPVEPTYENGLLVVESSQLVNDDGEVVTVKDLTAIANNLVVIKTWREALNSNTAKKSAFEVDYKVWKRLSDDYEKRLECHGKAIGIVRTLHDEKTVEKITLRDEDFILNPTLSNLLIALDKEYLNIKDDGYQLGEWVDRATRVRLTPHERKMQEGLLKWIEAWHQLKKTSSTIEWLFETKTDAIVANLAMRSFLQYGPDMSTALGQNFSTIVELIRRKGAKAYKNFDEFMVAIERISHSQRIQDEIENTDTLEGVARVATDEITSLPSVSKKRRIDRYERPKLTETSNRQGKQCEYCPHLANHFTSECRKHRDILVKGGEMALVQKIKERKQLYLQGKLVPPPPPNFPMGERSHKAKVATTSASDAQSGNVTKSQVLEMIAEYAQSKKVNDETLLSMNSLEDSKRTKSITPITRSNSENEIQSWIGDKKIFQINANFVNLFCKCSESSIDKMQTECNMNRVETLACGEYELTQRNLHLKESEQIAKSGSSPHTKRGSDLKFANKMNSSSPYRETTLERNGGGTTSPNVDRMELDEVLEILYPFNKKDNNSRKQLQQVASLISLNRENSKHSNDSSKESQDMIRWKIENENEFSICFDKKIRNNSKLIAESPLNVASLTQCDRGENSTSNGYSLSTQNVDLTHLNSENKISYMRNNKFSKSALTTSVEELEKRLDTPNAPGSTEHVIDSGATYYMVNDKNLFLHDTSVESRHLGNIYLANDAPIPILGKGTVLLDLGNGITREIKDVLLVPQLSESLCSISHLLKDTKDLVIFSEVNVWIYLYDIGKLITIGHQYGGLYYLNLQSITGKGDKDLIKIKSNNTKYVRAKSSHPYIYWHVLFGHASHDAICRTLKTAEINFNFSEDEIWCHICDIAKFTKLPIPMSTLNPQRFLYMICEDTFPLRSESYYRHLHCMVIYDKYSHYSWTHWLRSKNENPALFMQCITDLEVKYNLPVVIIQSDRGELATNEFREFCANHKPNRLEHHMSPSDTQSLNGAVERHIGIIKNKADCMLATSHLPYRFIYFSVNYAVELQNILVNSRTGKSPMELQTPPRLPKYKRYYPFGCLCAVYLPREQRRPPYFYHAEPGIFLGLKGTTIQLVYKYRTQKIHEEYHVHCHPMVFPGLTLKPEHQNPFLLLSFADDQVTSAIEGGKHSESQGPRSADVEEHVEESWYSNSSGVEKLKPVSHIDHESSRSKLPFEGQLCEVDMVNSMDSSIHKKTLTVNPNNNNHMFERITRSKNKKDEQLQMQDANYENLSDNPFNTNPETDNFEIVIDVDTQVPSNMELDELDHAELDESRLDDIPIMATVPKGTTLNKTESNNSHTREIDHFEFQAYARRCAHYKENSELVAEYGIQYPVKTNDDNIDELPNLFALAIVDEFAKQCAKFVRILADSKNQANKTKSKRHKKALRRETKYVCQYYDKKIENLEKYKSYLNKDRKSENIIDWTDTAETAVLPDKINKLDAPPVPTTVHQAVNHKFAKYFKRAMQLEMESLRKLEVYEVVPPVPGRKVIKSKWVYDYKVDPEGFITKLKARLVAAGYGQVENVDYKETFSPVVKIKSIRLVLAMAVNLGLLVDQIDIDTAFLHGILDEVNYMKMPEGFNEFDTQGNPLVCKLIKSLYGLHQAGRAFHQVLVEFLINNEFKQLLSESCILYKIDPITKKLVFICIYVDDLVILSNAKTLTENVKTLIRTRFPIKDLGEAQWILKIQITKVHNGIWMGQKAYAKQILTEFGYWDIPESKWKPTPMLTTWSNDESSPVVTDIAVINSYRSKLMKVAYLSQQTRPDLLCSINIIAQYQAKLHECHISALNRVYEYLRKTYDYGLYYSKVNDNQVILFDSVSEDKHTQLPSALAPLGYADASYANEEGRKSRSGYMFMVFGCVISWFSKKQATVSLSSTEAEFIALTEAIKESLWLRQLISEMGFIIEESTIINQDNQSTIAIALDPINHGRVKHMDIKMYFIREHLKNKEIKLIYCPTELMIADILTKPLPTSQHWKLVDMMGMRRLSDLQDNNSIIPKAKLVVRYT